MAPGMPAAKEQEIDMTPALEQMNAWFDEFNGLVFADELPKVRIVFTNTRTQLGQFFYGSRGMGIKISLFYDCTEEQFRNSLLHEMCHLYCYCRGWIREGHGRQWREIAAFASRKTGLEIKRVTDINGWKPSPGNEGKLAAVKAKKKRRMNAPALVVDLEYDTYHFLVRLSKTCLFNSADRHGNLITGAKSCRIVISDAPRFLSYQSSRSIRRGYKYSTEEYEQTVKPLLDKGVQVRSVLAVRKGEYDRLGIR